MMHNHHFHLLPLSADSFDLPHVSAGQLVSICRTAQEVLYPDSLLSFCKKWGVVLSNFVTPTKGYIINLLSPCHSAQSTSTHRCTVRTRSIPIPGQFLSTQTWSSLSETEIRGENTHLYVEFTSPIILIRFLFQFFVKSWIRINNGNCSLVKNRLLWFV